MEALLRNYQENYDNYKSELARINRYLYGLSFIRLGLFVGVIVSFYLLQSINLWLALGGSAVVFAVFLLVVRFYIQKDQQRKIFRNLAEVNREEMIAVCGDYSIFSKGEKHIDSEHDFSFDLDVFGEGGIFQLINRTSTAWGDNQLAQMLKAPLLEVKKIEERQEAISELAGQEKWRQKLQAIGRLDTSKKDKEIIESWQQSNFSVGFKSYWNWLIWLIPAITISALIFAVFTGVWSFFNISALAQLAILGVWRKQITQLHISYGKKKQFLRKYIFLLEHVHGGSFESELLKQLQQKIVKEGNAIQEIKELDKCISALDTGFSVMGLFLLNTTLLWNLRYSIKLVEWHKRCKMKVTNWFEVIGELEALSSLGSFSKNHPHLSFPQPVDQGVGLDAKELGHPLLSVEKCVVNDIKIEKAGDVHIITGANMAGKSTFLRAVGVNMVLAMIGAPVFARKMQFVPIRLFTHMRTTDSLVNDESYFYAELKRLRYLLDKMRLKGRVFVILDEILRGTNSVDKLNGSREFVRRLLENNTPAIVATHDLKLAEMESEFPNNIFNQCFEVTLDDGQLEYSYKLSQGVTKTMNATYLMEEMGIIPKKN